MSWLNPWSHPRFLVLGNDILIMGGIENESLSFSCKVFSGRVWLDGRVGFLSCFACCESAAGVVLADDDADDADLLLIMLPMLIGWCFFAAALVC